MALDLALIYLETGRSAKVPAIVFAVEQVFRAQQIQRDALTTWMVLREAIERNRLHAELLKDVSTRLEHIRDRS